MKCLLLNSTYDSMSFITEIRAIKLYFNDKIEVISTWDETINWVNGSMKVPAIVKLNYYIRWIPKRNPFNRLAVFNRDNYTCQYCNVAEHPNNLTIDHIVPKSKGGLTSWMNTITSCKKCNSKKDNKTLQESGMKLSSKPFIPVFSLKNELKYMSKIHNDWIKYIR